MALAEHTVAHGDFLRIDVIDREAAPAAATDDRLEVVRSLPDVERTIRSKPIWAASRMTTYTRRARMRSAIWRDGHFDVAHIHYLNRFTDIRLGAHRPAKVVISVHDVVPHNRRGPAALERSILRRIYNHADALVVHHRRLGDALVADFSVPEDRVEVIGHQVFPVPDLLRARAPEGDTPTVLFFGSLRQNKGVSVLAEAIRMIPHDTEVRFRFAGHGDEKLETLLHELASTDRRVDVEIGFTTYERKAQLFRESTIVVLPYTEFSSQSGVLHDAYGHGRPVVVTDVGALGDTVREDGTGVVIEPSAPEALAHALVALLASEDRRTAMEDAARRVSSERSPELLGRELRALYSRL